MTVGDDWLTEGADDEVPVLPVVPVVPVVPVLPVLPVDELPEVADDPPLVVAAPEPDDVPLVALLPEVADPGWSRDTTTPMTTVAPAAATTTPRVRLRSRDRAFSLFSGVLGWSMDDMRSDVPLPGGTPSSHHR